MLRIEEEEALEEFERLEIEESSEESGKSITITAHYDETDPKKLNDYFILGKIWMTMWLIEMYEMESIHFIEVDDLKAEIEEMKYNLSDSKLFRQMEGVYQALENQMNEDQKYV